MGHHDPESRHQICHSSEIDKTAMGVLRKTPLSADELVACAIHDGS
jgi:hypothetical protein